MKTVHLTSAYPGSNCSMVSWCYPATEFTNSIQKLILFRDLVNIECGKHDYKFNLLHKSTTAIPFLFHETNLLMQLVPGEPDDFYLKAALREFMNTFTVFNFKGERVYPEDIV